MGQWYWISEYLKLLMAYGFVLYVWPQVVFEKHLRGKRLSYRYGFCVIVTVLLVNAAVLLLGLLHLLRPWVTTVIFLGVFFWRLFANHHPFRELEKDLQSLHHETMSARRLILRSCSRLKTGFKAWLEPLRARVRGSRLEYGLLLAALVFGTIYFSWGAFDEHSFGCGDQYVHHQWIYALTQGSVFYDGVYPEAMHCMIYLTCTVFRIRLYSGVLFFAGLYVHVLLISVWLLMKEIFRWQYTPLAALALFLCIDHINMYDVYAMSRLTWTLPMEYAMYAVFLSGLFLLRFLKRVMRGERVELHIKKPAQWGIIHDEDLFLFTGAVAVTLAVHFYTTVLAFVICGVTALVYIRQVFRRGSFLPLAAAVMLAFLVAAAPMAAALAMGYPLQGSLYWAAEYMGFRTDNDETGKTGETAEMAEKGEQAVSEETGGEADREVTETTDAQPAPAPKQSLRDILRSKAYIVYWAGYYALYPGRRAKLILAATAFAVIVPLFAHMILAVHDLRKRRAAPDGKPAVTRDALDGVLMIALISITFIIMYCALALGIPQLLEGERICSTQQLLISMLLLFPLDCLMALPARLFRPGVMKVLAVMVFFGVYASARIGGFFHSYLSFELMRYGSAVETTNHIMDTLPQDNYTIISTTEELYQVIERGYHEELLQFIQKEKDKRYTIPTPYLLLYIEKHPIVYAQYHFADGPAWLACKNYPALFPGTSSQCPEILSTRITGKAADEKLYYGEKLSDSAADREGRRILESRAFRWYQEFSAMHPRDCRVIYEDDDFMCCCITQNPGSLYTLGIMGGSGK